MAAVTQRVPNYLGGVSQQTDELKFPGQLRECKNGYPDPTFGLMKRPGSQFLAELKDDADALITPGTYDNGKWFSIFRDNNEQYVVVISGTDIKVWSLIDGTPRNVVNTGQSYLTGTKNDYEVLTINDYTFVTNKTVTVLAQADPTYNFKRDATVRLEEVSYGAVYEVTVGGNTATYTTYNAEATVSSPSQTANTVNADVILDSLTSQIGGFSGFTATKIGTTIEITGTSDFDLAAKGGQDGEALVAYMDNVENISKLPSRAKHNRIVRVTNSVENADDYYLKFIAEDGISGIGYWEETLAPNKSPGLQNATMPHALIRQANGDFTFGPHNYEPRLVGDDISNSHPSFKDQKIQQLFFYNNRLGALTEENVSMSQAGDYFNFYHSTALTVSAADPVDISCSSVRPAILHAVVPVAQGLLLFSRSQQFLLQGANGVLTPGSTTIKTISNYEMDPNNKPVDMGTTVTFASKTPSYSRVFEMQTRGQDESPIVVDISRIVPEWIPSTVDQVVSSPQNSLLSLGSTSSKELYLFRFYTSGEKRETQSWFKWVLQGNVMHHAIDRDIFWAITKQESSYVIQKISLIQSPTSSTFLTSDGSRVDPRLDLWEAPTSTLYDSTPGDKHTRVYLPFQPDTSGTLCVVTANPNQATPIYSNSGLVQFPEVLLDGTGYYAKVENFDLTSDDLIVGYTYDMEFELPRTYFRSGNSAEATDWSASLTIARMKFLLGLGGDVIFKIRARGRSEWVETEGVKQADYYIANDIPFVNSAEFTVPIHQRSENIEMIITSSSPFPVSLLQMRWEGNYSPRYYRRA